MVHLKGSFEAFAIETEQTLKLFMFPPAYRETRERIRNFYGHKTSNNKEN